jgi:alginate O-acetyltransferase complex protein AlgI
MLFTMGMAKKVLIADRLAEVIKPIWSALGGSFHVDQSAAWAATLGYTFQLYFDFSGYSDMAVGLGHLFGLKLPQNFDSPYKATDAMDFWRRWHITLSMWLRDYLYIPLGGNRTGHRMRNLMITMLLGGLWHGAGWQFLAWGGWHGALLIGYHKLRDYKLIPPDTNIVNRFVNRQVMFFMVIIGWVLFRAPHLRDAVRMYGDWFGFASAANLKLITIPSWFFPAMLCCWLWCNVMPNSFQIAYATRPRVRFAMLAGTAMAVCVFFFGSKTDFLYFQF